MKSVLVMLAASVLVACSDVPSGYVGIKVNLLGGDKGVDTQELGTGRYWIGMNEQLYTFPTFSQNQVWTKDKNEGSPNDDSVSFQTADGLEVNTDIGISYHIDPTMVSVVFQKYRKGIDEITNVYIRSAVRNALVNAASTKKIETVYGAGKSELLSEVKLSVKQQCVEFGIVIDEVYWIGTFRLPPSIITSINDKATASQKTQQREQEIQQSRAEADKKIEEARK